MKLTEDMNGARFTVVQAAELANMHPAHFRRLCRRGVFARPKRNAKGRPYFDHELLTVVGRVLKTGVGASGEEVMFNRRRPKAYRGGVSRPQRAPRKPDPYLSDLATIFRQLGAGEKHLAPEVLDGLLRAAFGKGRPPLETAVAKLVSRIFGA